MSRLYYIICLILAVSALASCEKSTSANSIPGPLGGTRASLSVILDDNDDPERQEMVRTIRFIVFDDNSKPKVDVNKFIEFTTPGVATDITATDLEVTADGDKMVVVVINEPAAIKNSLDKVKGPSALEQLTYDIQTILNADGSILESSGMPMVGVIKGVKTVADEVTEVEMVVERAVARVDMYLEVYNGGAATTGYTKDVTKITLHNVSYESYFAMGNIDNGTRDNTVDYTRNFGQMIRNVAVTDSEWVAPKDTTWTYSAATGARNRCRVCSFYVGERLFRTDYSDRLAVSMSDVIKESTTTEISNYVIETVSGGRPGEEVTNAPFTEIRRNNVYQVTGRIGKATAMEFDISVESWSETDIDIPIN